MKATTGHKTNSNRVGFKSNRKARHILPVLAVVGGACSLVAGTASALELGDIRIQSALGQPLRASISYALNPHEQLYDFCIYLRPGTSMTGVPTISRPKITVDNGTIFLAGNTPILEPILSMHVSVDCPYTANLAREYTLMINPAVAEPFEAPLQEVAPAAETAQPVQSTPVAETNPASVARNAPLAAISPAPAEKPTPVLLPEPEVVDETTADQVSPVIQQNAADPISVNSQYFVQTGDSASSIARRIENRPVGLWPAVNAIFAANPEAFVDGDINHLTAAVWLNIPSFSDSYVATDFTETDYSASQDAYPAEEADTATADGYQGFDNADPATQPEASFTDAGPAEDTAPVVATVDPVAEPAAEPVAEAVVEPVAEPVAENVAEPVVEIDQEPVVEVAANDEVAPVAAADDSVVDNTTIDDTAVLRPGDVVTDAGSNAETDARTIPVVSRGTVANEGYFGVPTWALLAGGSVLALILAFFAFGRTIRERLASRNAVAPQIADELLDDEETTESPIVDDVDFQFDDSTIHSQSISLDADLGEGTGLQDSSNLDVAQDFGFSATASNEDEAAMDLELPEEPVAQPEDNPTDIIEPSHRIEEALVAEETPAAEDTQASTAVEDGTEYDLSMIVDATKQPLGEEEQTARDLMAVRVDDGTATEDLGGQTLSSEVDIANLEKDYEDEFTQTQALNDEIARAAEELALRMHEEEDSAEVTSKLESVEDPAMTATVEAAVEAGNDDVTEIADFNEPAEAVNDDATEIASLDEPADINDLDDTSVNTQLTENLNQPGTDPTVQMPNPGSEKTVEMPHPGSEPTVEMANPGNDATVEMPVDADKKRSS